MDIDFRFRIPRLTPLASCLAASLAIASGTFAPAGRSAAAMFDPADRSLGPAIRLPDAQTREAIERKWRGVLNRKIPAVPANSIPVTNCNDSGSGSLRAAVNSAGDTDTIDMTGLTCGLITLTTGAIAVTQGTLTLQGPGSGNLAISGNHNDIVFLHDETGTLYIEDLTIESGYKYFTDAQIDAARGGCLFSGGIVFVESSVFRGCEARSSNTTLPVKGGAIYAAAGVVLNSSVVKYNQAHTNTYRSYGGGIYSAGYLTVIDSLITGNEANGGATGADRPLGGYHTFGGGANVHGSLFMKYSTVSYNQALNNNGGGIFSEGNAEVVDSTVNNNAAAVSGGLELEGSYASQQIIVENSTISGNSAIYVGGVSIDHDAVVASSTIAFNTESSNNKYGAGLSGITTVELQSTIVDHNYLVGGSSPLPDDVGGNGMTLSGSGNLIGLSQVTTPPGTLSGSARLDSLAYNGGPTKTHLLLTGSQAINAGNNSAGANYDQRGNGFPRTIGPSTDIGAFELDTSDLIFADGFDP